MTETAQRPERAEERPGPASEIPAIPDAAEIPARPEIPEIPETADRHPTVTSTFAARATSSGAHPLTAHLLHLMEVKQSNLCLSADVPTARELLNLAAKVGPYIVVLKTHYDLVSGWDFHPQTGTGAKLAALSRKYGFLIFEDRKFGDIGSTVQQQYVAGSARVIEWAHITNVNMVPGPAVVTALAEAATKWKERLNYEVKTCVSAGLGYVEEGEGEDEGGNDGEGGDDGDVEREAERSRTGEDASRDAPRVNGDASHSPGFPQAGGEGRKGSIVSITTVTQSFEPIGNPRGGLGQAQSADNPFAGLNEPPNDRGLLILAQMSSAGNFMGPDYTKACVEAARRHKGFVMGFVAQQSLNTSPEDDFVVMTPGCQLPPEEDTGQPQASQNHSNTNGDGLGQQYNTPENIVRGAGCDIVIVGRGIIKAGNPQSEADRYRRAAWKAYLDRLA